MSVQQVIGVDPGSRTTGMIAISAAGLVRTALVVNEGKLFPPPADYVRDVTETARELADFAQAAGERVKVESLTVPSWHVAVKAKRGAASNPEGVLGAAVVLGALIEAFPGAVLVPPRGNGSKPNGAYPEQLIGPREKRGPDWRLRVGKGKLRHVRSAWDIAHYTPGASTVKRRSIKDLKRRK